MDFTEYRQRGKEMVDYIADYLENIRDRRVFPDVKPGYMKNLLPDSAPIEGEQWDAIFGDVERVIMPGITHWQSPHMHAYFPALNSFPSLLGDMLADAINCLGFTWASSPACTELEIIVMNWLGKMINLPDDFLHLSSSSRGGGVVQTTASEATLVCLLAGRTRAIQRFHEKRPGFQDAEINARLVAYCSDQAHSSVEKAALIGLVRMRYIEADENLSMRGQLLREAIEDDIRQGLVPFWVCATLGTTGSCSFDNLEEIGKVCREFNLWLHVDAAYAGSAFICPEFRTWLKGIERADSIAFNPSKWLMIHFDATALWVKDSTAVHRTFNVEPLYLQHENSGVAVDFMHWQIPLSRRFRALKIWFVLRSFGIKGLQRHIREGVRLAQKFEALVLADHRFEIPAKRHLGLVVFRIKGENEITERLLKRLNHRGNLHCIPSSLKGKYVIRFTVTSTRTSVDDILKDWMEIKNAATAILDEMNITISNRVYLKDTKEKCEAFGSSLLLSNSPLSPKIVNGSFAALFDADEFLAKTYAGIRIAHQESPSMRRRVRGILMSGKQFSLDSHMDVVVQTSMNSHASNSKAVDYEGKATGSVKNEEPDSICEDEESLEDCEMNWLLQLNPTNYLAVLNNQKLTPIDIIQHQNNLSILTKYASRHHTKSVNSIRTPLTQYQHYTCPRRPTPPSSIAENQIAQGTEQQNNFSVLYPGKRYLNLDLSLHNASMFSESIYNLPTPTEDIIPIIITAETPTSRSKSIEEIGDVNMLRPPSANVILGLEFNDDLEDLSKFRASSALKPIVETDNEVTETDLVEMVNSKIYNKSEETTEVSSCSSFNEASANSISCLNLGIKKEPLNGSILNPIQSSKFDFTKNYDDVLATDSADLFRGNESKEISRVTEVTDSEKILTNINFPTSLAYAIEGSSTSVQDCDSNRPQSSTFDIVENNNKVIETEIPHETSSNIKFISSPILEFKEPSTSVEAFKLSPIHSLLRASECRETPYISSVNETSAYINSFPSPILEFKEPSTSIESIKLNSMQSLADFIKVSESRKTPYVYSFNDTSANINSFSSPILEFKEPSTSVEAFKLNPVQSSVDLLKASECKETPYETSNNINSFSNPILEFKEPSTSVEAFKLNPIQSSADLLEVSQSRETSPVYSFNETSLNKNFGAQESLTLVEASKLNPLQSAADLLEVGESRETPHVFNETSANINSFSSPSFGTIESLTSVETFKPYTLQSPNSVKDFAILKESSLSQFKDISMSQTSEYSKSSKESLNLGEAGGNSSAQPSTPLEEISKNFKEIPNTSSKLKDFPNPDLSQNKCNSKNPKPLTILEESSVFPELNRKSSIKAKIFNNSQEDDSSSSDEFSESQHQPLQDSEGSSSDTSSLELM